MIERLIDSPVPAEQAQLKLFEGDRKAYDLELRPRRLSVKRGSPARETARGPARGIPEEVGGRSVSSPARRRLVTSDDAVTRRSQTGAGLGDDR
jgi:hypothetical protein